MNNRTQEKRKEIDIACGGPRRQLNEYTKQFEQIHPENVFTRISPTVGNITGTAPKVDKTRGLLRKASTVALL